MPDWIPQPQGNAHKSPPYELVIYQFFVKHCTAIFMKIETISGNSARTACNKGMVIDDERFLAQSQSRLAPIMPDQRYHRQLGLLTLT